MTTITRTYDIPDLLHALRDAAPEYPPALLEARREAFQRQIIEARLDEIEEALNDPFIDKATAFALLDELAELITHQGKE